MEIGSIFEIDINKIENVSEDIVLQLPFLDETYKLTFFNTGRSAIESLFCYLKSTGIKKVWLPAFLCSSVKEAVERAGVEIKVYSVGKDLSSFSEVPDNMSSDEVFYVTQYFGQQYCPEAMNYVKTLRGNGIIIIEDITMSLLSKKVESFAFGDFLVGSLRKWFSITDGGFIASKKEIDFYKNPIATNDYSMYYFAAQVLKNEYLKNPNRNTEDKQVFLSLNQKAMQSLFSDYEIREMSIISKNLMVAENIDEVIEKRAYNYDLLYSLLKEIPEIYLLNGREATALSLGMFILTDERDELFNYLIKNDVYCNIHWRKNDMMQNDKNAEYLSQRCITLPCDQRYGEKQMRYIYSVIKSYFEGERNVSESN